MKIRTGFVSNSSSSSFVIQNKYEIPTKSKVTVELEKMWKEWKTSNKFYKNTKIQDILTVYEVTKRTDTKDLIKTIEKSICNSVDYSVKPGIVLIISTGDNSIPWEFCELIEEKFNTKYIHHG